VAFCADVTDSVNYLRGLVLEHGRRLRPIELDQGGRVEAKDIEIWVAKGDTEIDVAYNKAGGRSSK